MSNRIRRLEALEARSGSTEERGARVVLFDGAQGRPPEPQGSGVVFYIPRNGRTREEELAKDRAPIDDPARGE